MSQHNYNINNNNHTTHSHRLHQPPTTNRNHNATIITPSPTATVPATTTYSNNHSKSTTTNTQDLQPPPGQPTPAPCLEGPIPSSARMPFQARPRSANIPGTPEKLREHSGAFVIRMPERVFLIRRAPVTFETRHFVTVPPDWPPPPPLPCNPLFVTVSVRNQVFSLRYKNLTPSDTAAVAEVK
ncbi:uncharacterized protein KIAA1522-like [Penaeus chinensis]|uniref:uncharacterized protein KIAA1522-like n=1 Tax=Penaeus chinensis TaxID=139456 RepID=UPI001FB58D6D|nr:uncharacterized protein KIAA1522-like [Penaeus chinensis]